MDKSKLNRLLRNRYLAAVIAGVVYAMAFPNFGIAGLAWIAPGILLLAARRSRGKEAFKIGWLGGFTIWMVMLYWLLFIPYRWMGLPLGPALGWIVLSAFLGLYVGGWVFLCTRLEQIRVGDSSNWFQRTTWALLCATLWVAIEMVQARFLSGFPWTLLGVSQHKLTPLIQIASFTGVYGVAFVVVWFSVSLLNAANVLIKNPGSYRSLIAEVFAPLVVVAVLTAWGVMRISQAPANENPQLIRIALVQPSIPQEVIWDPSAIPARFQKLMEVSEAALKEKPDLIVWPEAAMPGFSVEHFSAITNMIVQNKAWMILGADDAEKKLEGGPNDLNFYNASFLFDPSGHYVASYRKLRLVMFGEYVPFTRWFPFLRWFTPVEGGFTPGKGPVQFRLGGLNATTSVLICFEDVFPHFTGAYAEPETDFLLNLTNDGWFGRSAAQWQHAMTALFRAVENGVPLVRCTNNGLTCSIDEFGRLREYLGRENGDVYSSGYLICEVPVGAKRERTFYNRHGDWFGWGCVVIGLLGSLPILTRRQGKMKNQ